jgi:hypothetical protein
MGRSGCITLLILSLSAKCEWSASRLRRFTPITRSHFELFGEERTICLYLEFNPVSSDIQSVDSQYPWSNTWSVCSTVVFTNSLDFMTFVSASVMFVWIGFSHVYKEPHLHSLVTTAPPITTDTQHCEHGNTGPSHWCRRFLLLWLKTLCVIAVSTFLAHCEDSLLHCRRYTA